MIQGSNKYKARVKRAQIINRATIILLASTLGMAAGYLATLIGKGS